jgi:leucyl aminopeptidase
LTEDIIKMKTAALLATICVTAVLAEPEQIKPRALFTIETAPGKTVQITEDERWDLAAVSSVRNIHQKDRL